MATQIVEQEALDNILASWDELAPLVGAVRERTNLTQTQAMLLMVLCQNGPDADDEGEDWRAPA